MHRALPMVLLLGCASGQSTAPPAPARVAATPPPGAGPDFPPGIEPTAVDPSVAPCDDFYRYACGGWLRDTPIPPDRSRWGRGFNVITERNQQILKEILEVTAAGQAPEGTPYAKQLGDLYATCTDETKLETALPELRAALRKIDRLKGPPQIAAELAHLHEAGTNALFAYGPIQDYRDATRVIGMVDQAGLGLPDREYYLSDAPKMKETREGYRVHVAEMFQLLGDAPGVARRKAAEVMDVETRLARASLDRVSQRDPHQRWHPGDRSSLARGVPAFDWTTYFRSAGTADLADLNVGHPPFVTEVGALVKGTSRGLLKSYLAWRLVSAQVIALPRRFADAEFAFQSRYLTGAKEDLPRWKKCAEATDQLMGEALGVPFVQRTFGADGKARTESMVNAIENAFFTNLDSLTWMDAATREKAREKARAMVDKIGYPDKWKTYDGLVTDRGTFFGNRMRAMAYETARELRKIGKPVDRLLWSMTPPTVNARYSGTLNDMLFPAGILQPPFFNKEATDPVNFGAMGMVVGHELTHGFDDQGRKFDARGNLTDWWTSASGQAFVERADCVKRQFDGYTVLDELHLNGGLTLGENVADLGGLKLAYAAMEAYAREHPDGRPGGRRFTSQQEFFLGTAQMWCTNATPEELRRRVATDAHAPPEYRVNGPLSNMPQFQKAFACKAGDRMVAQNRCEVW